jgi:predicted DNA-binding protein (MmcQ/YjbR family)
MNIEDIRRICLSKKGVTESFPFDDDTLVFKVAEKMFCLSNLTPPISINLKCNPERAIELRERYEDVIPGYHMNKKHWNTVMVEGDLEDQMILSLIDHSYDIVVSSFTMKKTKELDSL